MKLNFSIDSKSVDQSNCIKKEICSVKNLYVSKSLNAEESCYGYTFQNPQNFAIWLAINIHAHPHTNIQLKCTNHHNLLRKRLFAKKGYFVPYAYISKYTHGMIYEYFC